MDVMPKYQKVEDSKSLTVKLSRSHYLWVKETASDLHIPPAEVIANLIEKSMLPVIFTKPRVEGAIQPGSKRKPANGPSLVLPPMPKRQPTNVSETKDERLQLFSEVKEAAEAGNISRAECVEAINPGKDVENWASWKAHGIPAACVPAAKAFLERLASQHRQMTAVE